MKLLFIGLGNMGSPMATNLINNTNHQVWVHDIDPERRAICVAQGGIAVSSQSEAITAADVIFTSLPSPTHIQHIANGEDGIFHNANAHSLWIELSTNDLATCRELVSCAKTKNIRMLDAPVSGGDEGAKAASLSIYVGGEKQDFSTALPLLTKLGKRIEYMGKHGAGYVAKIAQVVLCYLHSVALSEAMMLGVSAGVTPTKMLEIIQQSTGRSYVADRYGPHILDGSYDKSFTLGLAHKDMRLVKQLATMYDLDLPMCKLVENIYTQASANYGEQANHLMAIRLLEEAHNTFLQNQLED